MTSEQSRSGYYSEQCEPGPNGRPFYFRREVLDLFRSDPRYKLGETDLHANEEHPAAGEVGWLQQYVAATGPDGESAIMVIHAHLNWLTETEQAHFKGYELKSGGISSDLVKPVLYGEGPETITPIYALTSALAQINLIVGDRLFRCTDYDLLADSEDFLPITHNSRKAFEQFAHSLDKVLSDNLSGKFFKSQGILVENLGPHRGVFERLREVARRILRLPAQRRGTLQRLRAYLKKLSCPEETIVEICEPLKAIRKVRQAPAHEVRADDGSSNYRDQQSELFLSAIAAVRSLCMFLGRHVHGAQWIAPPHLSRPMRPLFE